MIDNERVLALIPARAGSKGLPGKNTKLLAGKPLLAWPVGAARSAALVDRVVVSTEDAKIAQIAATAGADVPFLRPPHLATDTASSVAVVLHALDELEAAGERYGYVVLLEPTSPFTEAADIDAALSTLHAARAVADAIVGVGRVTAAHPEYSVRLAPGGLISPFLAPGFDSLKRRQDVEVLYFLDGSLYGSSVAAIREKRSFYHQRTMGHVMPRWKTLEIDDAVDFICVEALFAHRANLSSEA